MIFRSRSSGGINTFTVNFQVDSVHYIEVAIVFRTAVSTSCRRADPRRVLGLSFLTLHGHD